MMKQPDSSVAAAATFTLVSCGQCGVDARPFLHYIRHRGIFRRLCTTCLLRTNSQYFCPTCFEIHDSRATTLAFPSQDTTTCSKCYSNSHSSCIGPNPNKPYICPLCTTQISAICNWENKEIDKKSAAALLAAAKIAVDSMSKAAAMAKAEAEKRAKEAAFTQKRTKEAIDHAEYIEEKLNKGSIGLLEISRFGTYMNKIVGNVGERNLFGDGIRMDRVDSSSAVLAALNAVELKEKEKQQGLVPMEVGVSGRSNGSDGSGRQLVPVVDVKPIAIIDQRVQNNHLREGNGGPFQ